MKILLILNIHVNQQIYFYVFSVYAGIDFSRDFPFSIVEIRSQHKNYEFSFKKKSIICL